MVHHWYIYWNLLIIVHVGETATTCKWRVGLQSSARTLVRSAFASSYRRALSVLGISRRGIGIDIVGISRSRPGTVCWALCSFLIDDHSIASPNAKAQPATSFFDHKTTSVFHHGSNTVNYWHRDLRHNWRCPLCPNIWCARDGQAIEGQCRVSLVAKRNTYVGTQRDPRPPRVFSGALASASGRRTMLVNRRVCHLFARIKFSGRYHPVWRVTNSCA